MSKKREIPNTNEIKMFFHCVKCFPAKPADMAPRDWVMIEAGWTVLGFQVWCRRCEANIMHMDFEGKKHPGNNTRSGETKH